MNRQMTKQCGFTLVELVFVVGISLVLVGFGLPLVKDYKNTYLASGVHSQFAESLQKARTLAVSQGKNIYLCASQDGQRCASGGWEKGWLVYQADERKQPGEILLKNQIIQFVQNSLENIQIDLVNDQWVAQDDIKFNARGFNGDDQQLVMVTCRQQQAQSDALLIERTGRVRLTDKVSHLRPVSQAGKDTQYRCNQA